MTQIIAIEETMASPAILVSLRRYRATKANTPTAGIKRFTDQANKRFRERI